MGKKSDAHRRKFSTWGFKVKMKSVAILILVAACGVAIISARSLDEKREELALLLKRILVEDRAEAEAKAGQKCVKDDKENIFKIARQKFSDYVVGCVDDDDDIDDIVMIETSFRRCTDSTKCPYGQIRRTGCKVGFTCNERKKIREIGTLGEKGSTLVQKCKDTCTDGKTTVTFCYIK